MDAQARVLGPFPSLRGWQPAASTAELQKLGKLGVVWSRGWSCPKAVTSLPLYPPTAVTVSLHWVVHVHITSDDVLWLDSIAALTVNSPVNVALLLIMLTVPMRQPMIRNLRKLAKSYTTTTQRGQAREP